jgi:hypothetical protein
MKRFARVLVRSTAPLGLAAFWGGMVAAALAYPAGYDWRYQAVSALLYPDLDPDGYLWGCSGLEVCGVAGVAWASGLSQRLDGAASAARAGPWLLRVGFVCMCFAVLPDRLLPLPKGHEVFAIFAFLGIGVGVMREMFMAVDRRKPYSRPAPLARLRGPIGMGMLLLPFSLTGLTLAYLALVRPHLSMLGHAWRARGIPSYLSFGAWEWVNCLVFSGCLLLVWRRRADA